MNTFVSLQLKLKINIIQVFDYQIIIYDAFLESSKGVLPDLQTYIKKPKVIFVLFNFSTMFSHGAKRLVKNIIRKILYEVLRQTVFNFKKIVVKTYVWSQNTAWPFAAKVNQSETKNFISYCVTAKSHIIHMGTHEHHPSLSHSHTYLCSAKFIANISRQHDNDRTLQGVYCDARYLVGLLAIYVSAAWNRAMSRMRLRAAGWPPLTCRM